MRTLFCLVLVTCTFAISACEPETASTRQIDTGFIYSPAVIDFNGDPRIVVILPPASTGKQVNETVYSTNGTGPNYQWSGTIPGGLQLFGMGDQALIQGTPSAPITGTFQISVTDTMGTTATRTFQFDQP